MTKRILAYSILHIAKELLAVEFPNQSAYDKYMKNHPGANKSKHTVKKDRKEETPEEVEERLKKKMGPDYKPQEKRLEDAKPQHGPAKVKPDFSRKTLTADKPKFVKALKVYEDSVGELEKMAEKGDQATKEWDNLEANRVEALQKSFPSKGRDSLSEADRKKYDEIDTPFKAKQKAQKDILDDLDKKSKTIASKMSEAAKDSEVELRGMKQKVDFTLTNRNFKSQVEGLKRDSATADLTPVGLDLRNRMTQGKKVSPTELKKGDYVFGSTSEYNSSKTVFRVENVTPTGRVKVKDIGRMEDRNVQFSGKKFPRDARLIDVDLAGEVEAFINESRSRIK